MITVRFPSGFSVQYNEANFVERGSGYSDVYKKLGDGRKSWVAQVPNTALIELVVPCRTYNPIAPDSNRVQASVDLLSKEIRSLKRKLARIEKVRVA